MYVCVRYGESEEAIFNPNCKNVIFLNVIRDRCCAFDTEVDLSDENGNVKNLRDAPHKYASEVLTDRERLVLLRVDRADEGETRFTPLLNDSEAITDNFLSQLSSRNLGRPSSKRHRRARTPVGRRDGTRSNNGSDNSSNASSKKNNKLSSNATKSKGKIK